jgi:hypothetical protein
MVLEMRSTTRFLPLLYLPWLLTGAITNVKVAGVTSSQAIISYDAPDAGTPCTVEVSESSAYAPLVYDVDPSLFSGANSDARYGSLPSGVTRVFVAGTHSADITLANQLRYSRALQANTPHYVRITCGTDQATTTFTTSNIPLGKTYGEIPPVDPQHPGDYAWPTWDWQNPTYRITDPWTGVLYQKFSRPLTSLYQLTGQPFGSAFDTGATGEWSNTQYAASNTTGHAASYSGANQNWLFLRTPATFGIYEAPDWRTSQNSFDYFQPVFKAWGSATASADRQIDVCLTVNGVTCTSVIRSIPLGNTEPASAGVIGTQDGYNRYWTDATHTFTAGDSVARQGVVNVDINGNVQWQSGNVFSVNWIPGSHITINGSDCIIASLTNDRTLNISPLSCSPALSLPAQGAAFAAANFGVLIRKSTNSPDAIFVKAATYNFGTSNDTQQWPAGGGTTMCSTSLVPDTSSPIQYGYHCSVQGMLYWVNPTSGEVRFLGDIRWPPASVGGDAPAGACTANSGIFDATNGNVFYCGVTTYSGQQIILKGTYTGNNADVGSGSATSWLTTMPINWVNLTPASTASLSTLASGFNNAFDPTQFTCGLSGATDAALIYFNCSRGGQDTISWSGIFDPVKRAVVALRPSWSLAPTRWCRVHSYGAFGNWFSYAFSANQDSAVAGAGNWTVKLPNNELATANVTACPSNKYGVTGQVCVTVAPLSEPCDFSPASSEPQNCVDYGSNSQPAFHLQDSQEGDVFTIDNEYLRLIVKNGASWVLQRGYGWSTPAAHSTPNAMNATCGGQNFNISSEQQTFWNFAADPNGTNSQGTTVLPMQYGISHSSGLPQLFTGLAYWGDCSTSGATCLAVYKGADVGSWLNTPPNPMPNIAPAFAGQIGNAFANFIEVYTSSAPSSQAVNPKQWFLLLRPFEQDGGQITANSAGNQLYKLTPGPDTRPLNRKILPTFATCGDHPMLDVSGPQSTINETAADNFKYCVANAAGECSDSTHARGTITGDVYANCPMMGAGAASCGPGGEDDRNLCLGDNGAYVQAISQVGVNFSTTNGGEIRTITNGFRRYRLGPYYWNARVTPEGNWMIVRSDYFDRQRAEEFLVKIPPFPERDGVDRSNFVPLTMYISALPDQPVDNALIEFGYAENGPAASLYCTSRQETCVAQSATVDPNTPFVFAQTETAASAPCSSGCVIAIPGIPQRLVYYRVKYRDAANNVLATTNIQVAAVP